jgi:excisionase family DNA binding protein
MRQQNKKNQTGQFGDERLTLDLWPEVGRALGLGRNSTFKAAKAGEIPVVKIGKRLLVPKAALSKLLEAK